MEGSFFCANCTLQLLYNITNPWNFSPVKPWWQKIFSEIEKKGTFSLSHIPWRTRIHNCKCTHIYLFITEAQRRSSWLPVKHLQEDLYSELHSWPSSFQTWVRCWRKPCDKCPNLALSDFGLISLATAGSGGPDSSLSLSTRSPSPPSWDHQVQFIILCSASIPEELDMDHCWGVSHFHPIPQQLLWWIFLHTEFRRHPMHLYTSKNSSAWWKVRMKVAKPSKLNPSSWRTFRLR